MFTFLLVVLILVYFKLVLVAGMEPARSHLSLFELNHRVDAGDGRAKVQLQREAQVDSVVSLIRVMSGLLALVFVLLSIVTFGWLLGSIIAVLGILIYGGLGQLKPLRRVGKRLYRFYEPYFLGFAARFPRLVRIMGLLHSHATSSRLGSRAELQYLVDESEGVLNSDEKKLIVHSLAFTEKAVSSVMTPRVQIATIKKSEFLGPLTLDELHKTGHSRLPVIDGDVDHVIGVLHLQSLLALDIKRSVTAEKAMEPNVFYIRQDQTLQHALAAFLRTHHHLFIVVNELRETVGLITLEDVIEALLGRKIVDEYDSHEDLRTVATRQTHSASNNPRDYEDV